MTREDKELILKDLCARLPYGVKVNITSKESKNRIVHLTADNICNLTSDWWIECKPYLFPFSSMTEEQKMEIKSLCDGTEIFDDGSWMSYISILGNFNFEINLAVVDWYNKNHFDYRGLIPKGLAIDATGLNIY